MKKKKLFAIILNALTLLNFLVGGLLGFILIKGEDLKKFRFIYFLCLGATIFCLLCSWLELRLTKTGKKYYKLRLKKWHIVKEQHQYKSDDKWSTVGNIGLVDLMLSLLVPWFALSTIWPESFLMSSLDVYLKCIGVVPVLFGIIIIILEYIRKKGVNE